MKPVEKKKKRNRALVEMRGAAPEMTVRCTEAVDGAHPALFSSLYLSLSLSHSHTLPPSLSLSLSLSLSPSLSTVSLPSPSPSSSPLPLATHRSVARPAKEKKNEMTATRQNITQVCGGEKKKKRHAFVNSRQLTFAFVSASIFIHGVQVPPSMQTLQLHTRVGSRFCPSND